MDGNNTRRLGIRERRKLLRENRGMLARVARKCGVSAQAVGQVWWGKSDSARIASALAAEVARIRSGG